MKKLIISLALILFAIPASAAAHVLEFDNGVGAVLHMDPQDEPIAGQSTVFNFSFSDKTGNFNARDCDCTFAVTQNGKQLFEVTLAAQSADAGSASYSFPLRGAYELSVNGKPRQGAGFGSFTLKYVIRVDKGPGAGSQSNYERTIYVSAGGIGLVIVFFLVRNQVVYNVKQYGKAKPEKSRNTHQH